MPTSWPQGTIEGLQLGGCVLVIDYSTRPQLLSKHVAHLLKCHPHHFAVVGTSGGRGLWVSQTAIQCLQKEKLL